MKKLFTLIAILIFTGWNTNIFAQAYTFTAGQLSFTESFDGMTTGTAYVPGWTAIRYAGSGAVGATLTIAVTDGGSNSGNIYNVGTTAAADRSFGSLASGSTVPRFGASFLNSTGSSITAISLTGMMEQWRSGSSNTVNEVNAFEYSLDATDLSSGTWIAVTGFDLAEKIVTSTTAAALNGNLPENQTAISANISGINWTPNSNLWIRWSDVDNTGSDGILTIDNLNMTVTTGAVTADPEPANYPTAFTAASNATSITAIWTDATTGQLPSGYLVKISTSTGIAAPADGTFEPDDLDLTDGSGAKNVPFGQHTYTFNGLTEGGVYNFEIFPYSNGGTLVDYKTNGVVPSATATTQSLIIDTKFDTDLVPWTQFSVSGDQLWNIDLTHGVNSSGCAKMSGYLVTNFANEDWLISPAINLTGMSNTKFQFYSAYNYAGNPLSVLLSSDYTGGDPTTSGTWTDISASAVFSPGGWAWTPSGYINLAKDGLPNVHIAFKYTSDLTAARTWEIDEALVSGDFGVGIAENGKHKASTRIYPNPSNGWFNAEMPDKGTYIITIANTLGSTVKVLSATSDKTMKIATDSFPKGLYFVTLQNADTKVKEVHKLLVR